MGAVDSLEIGESPLQYLTPGGGIVVSGGTIVCTTSSEEQIPDILYHGPDVWVWAGCIA